MKKIKRYYASTLIKKRDVPDTVNHAIQDDLNLFNHMKMKWFAHPELSHVAVKKEYAVNDYFVTSVEGTVKGIRSSQKELLSDYIKDVRSDLAEMEKKLGNLTKRLEGLKAMKVSLIQHSKSGGEAPIRNFKSSGISFRKNGTIRVGMPKNFTTYGNLWDFEHLYLEPSIRKLKHPIHCLKDGIDRKKRKLHRYEKQVRTGRYSVFFGSRKLYHSDTARKNSLIQKKRYGRMMLSGRLDAECGNFMIHYDPETHILSYRGSSPSKHYEPVGRILFPSGQDLVDQATAHTGVPVGWSVVDLGNAWRFDACLTLLYDENPESSNGWICMDINSGHLAVVETDSMGCPRSRKVIHFPQNRSREENTRAASEALELVFRLCLETGKPLAAEDIGKVNRKASRYSKEQKRNRAVSLFPSSKLLELIESKARKYGIGLKLVNPSYTSQIGKMKYMRHYGMSIHESAALAIGRRAAGFEEKLPREYRSPSTQRWKQWKAAYPVMKKLKPADLYVMKPAS